MGGNFTTTANDDDDDGGDKSGGKGLESSLPAPMSFLLNQIYLLQRRGDDGQFERVVELFLDNDLGGDLGDVDGDIENDGYRIFHPPSPFPAIPSTEED